MNTQFDNPLTPQSFKSKTHTIVDPKPINAGTRGKVYKAVDLAREEVCLKLQDPENERAKEKIVKRNLVSELTRVSKESGFGGRHIISSRPFITEDGRPYSEMPLLSGDLSDYLTGNEGVQKSLKDGLTEEQSFQLMRDIATGTIETHEIRGETHADIKTSNVLVMGRKVKGLDRLMLGDFGNASIIGSDTQDKRDNIGGIVTRPKELFVEGSHPTIQSDFYSAAAVMYEIVTGKKPLEHILTQTKNPIQYMQSASLDEISAIIDSEIESAVPTPLKDFFRKNLSPRPEDRAKTDGEFQKDVEKAIRKYERAKPLSRLKRWGTSALATAAALGAIAYGVVHSNDLSSKLGEKNKQLSFETKLRNIRMYQSGNYGQDTLEALNVKEISAWVEKFKGDKELAFAAYFDPDFVFKAIKETSATNYAGIKEKIVQNPEVLAYMAQTIQAVDNFARFDYTYGKNSVSNKWAAAESNYNADIRIKQSILKLDERGKTTSYSIIGDISNLISSTNKSSPKDLEKMEK